MKDQTNAQPDAIDINDSASCAQWAKKLDVTATQLNEAVANVGNKAADVEMHLKGSRSTTNADLVNALKGQ